MPDEAVKATIEDAFGAAEQFMEHGQGDLQPASDDAAAVIEQAPAEEPDQAEVSNEQETVEAPAEEAEADDSVFGDVELPEPVAEAPAPVDPNSVVVDVPGIGTMAVSEWKDGVLRQADYTRKTQELAAQRKEHELAIKVWEAIQSDPQGALSQLAAEAGLIEPGTKPVKVFDEPLLKTQADIDAEVEKRVQERLATDPRVQQTNQIWAKQVVNKAIDDLGASVGQKFSESDRALLVRTAGQLGTTNLEAAYAYLVQKSGANEAQRAAVAAAAPSTPSAGSEPKPPTEIRNPKDAFELAERQLADLA